MRKQFWFPIRPDTNWPVHLHVQNHARSLKRIGSGNSTEEGVGVKHAYDLKLPQCRWPDREIKTRDERLSAGIKLSLWQYMPPQNIPIETWTEPSQDRSHRRCSLI